MERSDNTGTAMLFEEHLLEQMLRVQQPPKMRKNSGVRRRRKSDFEREERQVHLNQNTALFLSIFANIPSDMNVVITDEPP